MTQTHSHSAQFGAVEARGADHASSVIGRVRAILDAFDVQRRSLSLSELSKRTSLPKSTTRRLAEAMVLEGLLGRTAGAYVPGIRLFEWGTLLPHQDLRNAATPFMEDLHAATRAIVNLAVLDENSVLYLEKITGHCRLPSPSRVGGRLPPHRTALGKVLLAYGTPEVAEAYAGLHLAEAVGSITARGRFLLAELSRVRESALGYDRQEAASSLACVAAPIFFNGDVIAAVSVSGAKNMNFSAVTPALRVAAAGIGRAYGRDLLGRSDGRRGGLSHGTETLVIDARE